jgi:hypothetical protein
LGAGGGGQEWVAALDTFNLREGSKWADQRPERGERKFIHPISPHQVIDRRQRMQAH